MARQVTFKFLSASTFLFLFFFIALTLLKCSVDSQAQGPKTLPSISATTRPGIHTYVNQFRQSPGCGIRRISEDDPRTKAPWTAVIFTRSRNPDGSFQLRYFTSGVIIGPTTIFTVAGGAYGSIPRNSNSSEYKIAPFSSFYIGVGLKSTSDQDADEFSQFSEVNFVLPYFDHESSNGEYHFVIYHLRSLLNTRTDQVREICLPLFFLEDTNVSPVEKYEKLNRFFKYYLGGFATPSRSYSKSQSALVPSYKIETGSVVLQYPTFCASAYRYHYKGGDPRHIFCAFTTAAAAAAAANANTSVTMTENQRNKISADLDSQFCHVHGSHLITDAEFPSRRSYLVSLLTSIPRYGRSRCNANKLSFYAGTVNHLTWLHNNYKCSPNRFACNNATCIPLSSLCNGIKDCADGEDENKIYCRATLRCPLEEEHQCGLEGHCISKEEICDGVSNCDDGSDEKNCRGLNPATTLNWEVISEVGAENVTTCDAPVLTEGVSLTCQGGDQANANPEETCNHTPGSTVILSCEQNFLPRYGMKRIPLTCSVNGKWNDGKVPPFSCYPNCGLMNPNVKSNSNQTTDGHQAIRIPWLADILDVPRRDRVRDDGPFCSGTLIEKSFLLTTAQCADELNKYAASISTKGSIRNKFYAAIGLAADDARSHASLSDDLVFKAVVERIWKSPSPSDLLSAIKESEKLEEEQFKSRAFLDSPLEDGLTLIKLNLTSAQHFQSQATKNGKVKPQNNLMPACYKKVVSDVMPGAGEIGWVPSSRSDYVHKTTISLTTAQVIPCPEGFHKDADDARFYFCINGTSRVVAGDGFFIQDPSTLKFYLRGIIPRGAFRAPGYSQSKISMNNNETRPGSLEAVIQVSKYTNNGKNQTSPSDSTPIRVLSVYPFMEWVIQTLEKEF